MPEKTCQKILLKEEIKMKNKKIKQYSLELNNVKNQLESKISFFRFLSHMYTLFKITINKNLAELKASNSNLISESLHETEKIISTFSSHEIRDDEKSLLCKGLKFSVPPKGLCYTDHMLPFQLLFWDINKTEMSKEDKDSVKSRLKGSTFTSFWS